MQSILPEVTAARPSATLRSNVWVRSERSASFDAASRITCENLSTMVWMRGRAMSRQACAEPITGPTRPARSRTIVMSPAACALPAMPKSMAPTSKMIRCGVMANFLENKSAVSRFSGMVSPPSGLWGGALWRGRIRLLAPLHELLEQLFRLLGRRRSARRRGGEKGLEFVDCRLWRSLSGLEQGGPDRLRDVGERRRRRLTVALPRAGHSYDEEQRHEGCDADGGSEARRHGPQCLLRLQIGFVHELRIERMAQRIGYRALELGVERHWRKRRLGACSARSRPLT